jgi:hypothetical protein
VILNGAAAAAAAAANKQDMPAGLGGAAVAGAPKATADVLALARSMQQQTAEKQKKQKKAPKVRQLVADLFAGHANLVSCSSYGKPIHVLQSFCAVAADQRNPKVQNVSSRPRRTHHQDM